MKKNLDEASLPAGTDQYDVVIAGAGVSGLSAALFYQQRFGKDKKILIVDPLKDFGGHAARNEFLLNSGETKLSYGGSESLQSPSHNFSKVVNKLIQEDLGVNLSKFEKEYFQRDTYTKLGMSRGVFFASSGGEGEEGKKENTKLVVGDPTEAVADDLAGVPAEKQNARSISDFIADFPYSEETKKQLLTVFQEKEADCKAALLGSSPVTEKYLNQTSYKQFLADRWKLNEEALSFFQPRTLDFFGLSPTHISAIDCLIYRYPGGRRFLIENKIIEDNDEAKADCEEPYIHHFPDGNASVARLLVQKLIPSAFPTIPAETQQADIPEKLLLAPLSYSALDNEKSNVNLRLSTSVVAVEVPDEKDSEGIFEVGYVRHEGEKFEKVRTKHVILACFNMLIPYLLRDASSSGSNGNQLAELKVAAKQNVKTPMIYTTCVLNNWKAFAKLGVHEITSAAASSNDLFHSRIKLDYPVDFGSNYKCSKNPDQPICLHLVHVPVNLEKEDARDSLRASRSSFFSLSIDKYTQRLRDDLTKILAPSGEFDFDKNVLAFTVNRYSHGYAYSMIGSKNIEEDEKTRDIIRKPLGGNRVVIANSDAGFSAYLHSAIDEAARAVSELK